MRKLPAFLMILALLLVNIVTAAHAECAGDVNCMAIGAVAAVDDAGDQHDEPQSAVCDCCATCGHSHHTHAALSSMQVEHPIAISKTYFDWSGDAYIFRLHYPLSKPPKA